MRLEQFRWWRFAYHRLIAAIPLGSNRTNVHWDQLGSTTVSSCELPILESLTEPQQDIAIRTSHNFTPNTVFV